MTMLKQVASSARIVAAGWSKYIMARFIIRKLSWVHSFGCINSSVSYTYRLLFYVLIFLFGIPHPRRLMRV